MSPSTPPAPDPSPGDNPSGEPSTPSAGLNPEYEKKYRIPVPDSGDMRVWSLCPDWQHDTPEGGVQQPAQ